MTESSNNAPHRKIRISALSGCVIMVSTPVYTLVRATLRLSAADRHEVDPLLPQATRATNELSTECTRH